MYFAVDWESMGQSKAKNVCGLLQELNEYVSAKFVEESP
jgi:amyloid beta precursor protein binding protein 1